MDHITRREFCKSAGLAVSGGMMIGSLPAGASAYAAGNDTIKVGLVGCGGRGTGAANQALYADEGVKIVALADAFRDRLDDCYDNLMRIHGDSGRVNVPEDHKFTGFDAYKHVIDRCDVVLLAGTPAFRPKHFEYAVDQGKHVFMEKPVSTDVPGLRRVLEVGKIADQKNLNVVVGLHRHYQNSYREVYRRVRNREVGDIIAGQVYFNTGGVWVSERQPKQTEMEYQMRNWYYFNWLSGDHIVEQHIHSIDVANWFIGDYPVRAQGMGGREVRTGKEYGQIFDHHFVEFTYPGGQIIASQCRHQPNTWSSMEDVFLCENGRVQTSEHSMGVIRTRDGRLIYDHDAEDDPSAHQQELDEFFASIRKGEVISDTENGAKSTLTAIMGRMASYSGQVITLEDAMASDRLLVSDDLDWDSDPPVLPDEHGNYPVPVPGVTQKV